MEFGVGQKKKEIFLSNFDSVIAAFEKESSVGFFHIPFRSFVTGVTKVKKNSHHKSSLLESKKPHV
jgi:hypothetical protein